MALLLNLNTSRRLYLVYLNLEEYIVVPYVQQISEYINNALIIVDIVLDYFLVSG